MPDISMCPGGNCPRKDSCYRYTATPSEWMQCYFAEPPVEVDGVCQYYWPTRTPEPIADTRMEGDGDGD